LIAEVLLVASLVAGAFRVPAVAAQETVAATREQFDQLLQSAEKARDENRDEEAVGLFRRALSIEPESEEALWYLGSMLYEREQYAQARDVLRQFLTIRPNAGPGWALLGLSEFQLREYPRALDHLQRAMAQGMGERKEMVQLVFHDVAALLTRFERYDDSLDMMAKMSASGSQDASLVEPAGLAGLRLPLLPTEIPPDRVELVELAGRAVLALETQQYETAEAEFKRLISAYPNEPGVHFLHGASLMQLNPSEAVPEFERELEISPSHALARVRLAEQLIAQSDFDRALALAQEAIKLEPKRASAHMLAGEALIAKGNADTGIKELENARENDPLVSRIHWDLLRAYGTARRKQDADRERQELEKLYRAKSPGHPSEVGDTPRDQAAPK
jgi:tetratricopeptide (TPR) repeat protein